mgnify:CR=1 FL=1
MPFPSETLATLRPDLGGSLTEFDVESDQLGFVGAAVMPPKEVTLQSATFGRIPLEQLLIEPETARAPGSNYNRGDMQFEQDSYSTAENGWEEPVDDREARMYRYYFDAELVSAQRARAVVRRAHEKRVADLVAASSSAAAGTVWSNHSAATPIADVEARKKAIWVDTGVWPNTVVMSRNVFRDCRRCDEILDQVKNVRESLPGQVLRQLLAEAFDVDQVLVAGGVRNTASKGKTREIAHIWGDTEVAVMRTAISDDIREPCFGRTMHWSEDGSTIGGTVESYRGETNRSEIIRVRMDTNEKVLYPQMCQRITDVAA